jgi:ribosome-binding factor A
LGRVAGALRTELADLLENKLRDPKKGFLTVTDVEVTRDLKVARVYVSCLGPDAERDQNLKLLERASGFLRSELAKRVNLRTVPELRFLPDRSAERGARIETILRNLAEGKEPADDADDEPA